jgi:hypothetical protein
MYVKCETQQDFFLQCNGVGLLELNITVPKKLKPMKQWKGSPSLHHSQIILVSFTL